MKILLQLTAAAFVTILAVLPSSAQTAYEQPLYIAPDFNLGPYASIDRTLASDPFETKAWDNFSLTDAASITGISWDGAYVEPFATGAGARQPETDFHIEILNDVAGLPVGVIYSDLIWGGAAGVNDANVTSTQLGHTAEFGGPVYNYQTSIPPLNLSAGNYWISITAHQTFPSDDPLVDPLWQWHLGSKAISDGLYSFDDVFDDPGDNGEGLVDTSPSLAFFQNDKDLSFALAVAPVPEPSSMLLAVLGLGSLSLTRKRR